MKLSKAKSGSRRKRILVEKEEKARKCVVIGSRNCSVSRFIKSFQNCLESSHLENEATLRLNETNFVFWEGTPGLKKSSLKQYLAYHGTQVLFFLINEADIVVREGHLLALTEMMFCRNLLWKFQTWSTCAFSSICILILSFSVILGLHIFIKISFIKMH